MKNLNTNYTALSYKTMYNRSINKYSDFLLKKKSGIIDWNADCKHGHFSVFSLMSANGTVSIFHTTKCIWIKKKKLVKHKK